MKTLVQHLLALLLLLTLLAPATPAATPEPKADIQTITTTRWLTRTAEIDNESRLSSAWDSKITITGNKFTLTHFLGTSKDLTGTITKTGPDKIDLNTDAVDVGELWDGVKYPPCKLPGIYKMEPGKFTLCVGIGPTPERPAKFASNNLNTLLLILEPMQPTFKDFPKNITVTVLDPAGKPAAEASILQAMSHSPATAGQWKYRAIAKTGPDGSASVPYGDLALVSAMARDAERKLIGLTEVSPASLQSAAVTVQLQPECLITGKFTCEAIERAGQSLSHTNVRLLYQGKEFAFFHSTNGTYEFHLPPGKYTLNAYGKWLLDKYAEIEVPADRPTFQMSPIELPASPLVLLIGKPAPELAGVVAWSGDPVKLADLRGKVVLLNFWGYWCGPCVHEMPTLVDLHDQFKDKGLVIIGVHVDSNGEVDTPKKLAEKTAKTQHELWKDKPLPFPIALTSGARTKAKDGESRHPGAAAQYGIYMFPTTILLNQQGNVVGEFEFHPKNPKATAAQIEALLAEK